MRILAVTAGLRYYLQLMQYGRKQNPATGYLACRDYSLASRAAQSLFTQTAGLRLTGQTVDDPQVVLTKNCRRYRRK